MTEENQEKKIIIDEDWKSQVEAEKEAAKTQEQTPEPDQPAQPTDEMEMPPASFSLLVTTLATQSLSSMGQMPDPVEGKPVVRLTVARHLIDSLAMLEEKTKGNLTEEEEQLLTEVLHQLRMVYVAVRDAAGSQQGQAGAAGEDGS